MAMEVTASPLDWAINDEENWLKFLGTETGRRVLGRLMEFAPVLLEKGDTNEIMIRSGELRGFQLAARALLEMAQSAPKATTSNDAGNYPPPEKDSAWGDGLKLEPEQPRNVLEPKFD